MAIDISSQTRRVVYTGSAGTGPYAYAFNILVNTDIAVYYNNIELTLTTDYSVSIGAAGTGNVTLVVNAGGNIPSTPSSSDRVTLIGDRTLQRTTDFTTGGPLFATTLNDEFDSLTIFTQQNLEQSNRSLRAPNTDPTTVNMELPFNTVRANKYLTFDASGNPAATNSVGTYKGNWAASTAYVLQDIVKDTSTNNIFIAITAHTSSGSQPLTTNADAAKWSLVVDAASATSSATAAEAARAAAVVAKSAAETAKAGADTAKAGADTAKAGADTAKAGADTAAAAAVVSKNAAATSATAAAATKLDFDKKYLGAYADGSIPSTGPGGTALLTGALYFNTTSNQIFVWTAGDAWLAIKPTSSEQTAITAVAADATDIGVVAGKATEIGRLGTSAAVADMAILATDAIVADMAILGTDAIVADMAILGSDTVVADMAILATDAIVADMAILGTSDVVTDMNVLGTSDVVTDMNVLGTSANVTAMGLLGTSANVTNIATVAANVAGVNSFADLYRGASASDPGGTITTGSLFYDTDASPKQLKIYNGSAWVAAAFDASGSVAAFNGRTGSVTLLSADVISALATGSIATAKIADDAITTDKLANSINSAITANTAKTGITGGQASAITANTAKVTNATHTGDVTGATALTIGNDKVITDKILNSNVTTAKIADLNVTRAKIADDAIDLAKMAPGTDGELITYDTSGNPAKVAAGSSGQVLTSGGAGAVPTFQTISSSPTTLKITRTITGGSVVNNRAVSVADDGSVGVLPTVNTLGTKLNRGTDSNTANYGTGLTKVRITFSTMSGTTSTMNIFGSYVNGSGLWVENSTPLTSVLNTLSGVQVDYQGQQTWLEIGSEYFHIHQYVHTNQVSNNNIVQQVFAVVVNASNGAPSVVGNKVVNERQNSSAAGRQVGIKILGSRFVVGRILISSLTFPAYYFNGSTWAETSDDVGQTIYDQGLTFGPIGYGEHKNHSFVNAANNRLMQVGNNQIRALTISSNALQAGVTNVTLSSDFQDGRSFFLDQTHILQMYHNAVGQYFIKTFTLAADGNSVSLISTLSTVGFGYYHSIILKGTDPKKITVWFGTGGTSNIELDSSYNVLGIQLNYTGFGVKTIRYLTGDTYRLSGGIGATPEYAATYTVNSYRTTPFRYVGVSNTTASSGTAQVAIKGLLTGFTGLTTKAAIYTDLAGVLSHTSVGSAADVGTAISPTEVLMNV